MNARLGWGLALAALGLGGALWGWQGLVLAASAVVFWLLMQFSRTLRIMRRAADSPMGSVPSAVMLSAKLSQGMTMLEVLTLTRSLGRAVGTPGEETWCWKDAGGDSVQLRFAAGRLVHWALQRSGALGGAEASPEKSPETSGERDAPPALIPPADGAT